MNLFKKYYEDVCEKRQQELRKFWMESKPVSYRWQDILKEVLEEDKKI